MSYNKQRCYLHWLLDRAPRIKATQPSRKQKTILINDVVVLSFKFIWFNNHQYKYYLVDSPFSICFKQLNMKLYNLSLWCKNALRCSEPIGNVFKICPWNLIAPKSLPHKTDRNYLCKWSVLVPNELSSPSFPSVQIQSPRQHLHHRHMLILLNFLSRLFTRRRLFRCIK